MMAHEVVMQQLGLSMEAGRIVSWLKAPGDLVRAGEPLYEVESDKANIEVEAVENGILQIVAAAGPEEIRVGSVIAYLLDADETMSASASTTPPASAPVKDHAGRADGQAYSDPTSPAAAASVTNGSVGSMRRLPSSPAARRHAQDLGVDWALATGTGPQGRIKVRDVLRLAAEREAPAAPGRFHAESAISPVARQMAERLGIEFSTLAGLFPGKRIERNDVEAAVRELLRRPVVPAPVTRPALKRRALDGLRRVIAERMALSAQTTAPVTLHSEVDATELVRLRETLKENGATPLPSYNAILTKIVATALHVHPDLNVTFENEEIVMWDTVNIAIAVDTARGLVAPVVRQVETRSLGALAAEMDELLPRAQAGKARPDELSGGAFTLTNLGMYGVDFFTPIINPPQAAILGVGRLVRKPVVNDDGSMGVRTMLGLSLTFDHRLVDGAPAARFLAKVRQFIEAPYLWLTQSSVTTEK